MFDLISGDSVHAPRPHALPVLVSVGLHMVAITLLAIPVLFMANQLPEVPTMMAFVAPVPAPPPPPPPPPPQVARAAERRPDTARPPEVKSELVAPLETPDRIEPEPLAEPSSVADALGVIGGVEGGVAGGVVGGVVGGLPEPLPPPPPPPVVAQARRPVRIGGEIRAPELVRRIEPAYPQLAVSAQIEGLAILEAVVDEAGRVTDVTILKSAHPLLDREAIMAVKQWRYSPLKLNGKNQPFVLTVTLSFSLGRPRTSNVG